MQEWFFVFPSSFRYFVIDSKTALETCHHPVWTVFGDWQSNSCTDPVIRTSCALYPIFRLLRKYDRLNASQDTTIEKPYLLGLDATGMCTRYAGALASTVRCCKRISCFIFLFFIFRCIFFTSSHSRFDQNNPFCKSVFSSNQQTFDSAYA